MKEPHNKGILPALLLTLVLVLCTRSARCMAMELPVTDKANIFTEAQKAMLINKLNSFNEETINQIAILTIKHLGYESLEEYANRVFNQIKPGQKGKSNGVLILFVLGDKKVRIKVCYGLEGYLTDDFCSRIISNYMVPKFKTGDYFNGLLDGATEVINAIGYPVKIDNKSADNNENGPVEDKYSLVVTIVICIFALAVFVFLYFLAIKSYDATKENLAIKQGYITKVYLGDYSLSAFFITFWRGFFGLMFGLVGLVFSVLIPAIILCYFLEGYFKLPLERYLFSTFILYLLFKFFIIPFLYTRLYLKKPVCILWRLTEEDKIFLKDHQPPPFTGYSSDSGAL